MGMTNVLRNGYSETRNKHFVPRSLSRRVLQFFVMIKPAQTVEISVNFVTSLWYDKAEFQHGVNTALYQTSEHYNEIWTTISDIDPCTKIQWTASGNLGDYTGKQMYDSFCFFFLFFSIQP
jgi:hypothetical protein